VNEPNVFILDSVVHQSAQIRAGSYLEKCVVKAKATIGPYARLRPGTEIGEEAHIGNFVELKNVQFGAKAKAGHLTYLGDAEIGEETNIGCGTITCNYAADRKKYKTKIGKNAFIGSDTQFIAPVEIGDNAVIGSGSTITKSVPANALAVARGRQIVKENYVNPGVEMKEEK
jgi:bifunctional UDP-N-acetylglucosamine pyrophosphorylase/glucosamine-1-phosphate N-acetyltransferase